MKDLRADGVKAGLFRPVTLWPFPGAALRKVAGDCGAKHVIVPEMNQGQLVLEVERVLAGQANVEALCRIDGEAITPDQIADKVREVAP